MSADEKKSSRRLSAASIDTGRVNLCTRRNDTTLVNSIFFRSGHYIMYMQHAARTRRFGTFFRVKYSIIIVCIVCIRNYYGTHIERRDDLQVVKSVQYIIYLLRASFPRYNRRTFIFFLNRFLLRLLCVYSRYHRRCDVYIPRV